MWRQQCIRLETIVWTLFIRYEHPSSRTYDELWFLFMHVTFVLTDQDTMYSLYSILLFIVFVYGGCSEFSLEKPMYLLLDGEIMVDAPTSFPGKNPSFGACMPKKVLHP